MIDFYTRFVVVAAAAVVFIFVVVVFVVVVVVVIVFVFCHSESLIPAGTTIEMFLCEKRIEVDDTGIANYLPYNVVCDFFGDCQGKY